MPERKNIDEILDTLINPEQNPNPDDPRPSAENEWSNTAHPRQKDSE